MDVEATREAVCAKYKVSKALYDSYLNKRVSKKFDDGLYYDGYVCDYLEDKKNMPITLRFLVQYEDGDTDDLTLESIEEILVETVSSTPPTESNPRKRSRAGNSQAGSKKAQAVSPTGNDMEVEDATEVTETPANAPANQIARAGHIREIKLENFMDHVNFIVGENGSGKSAILTALSICFGERARSTNRASSLKNFIKTGCSQAIKFMITVSFCQQAAVTIDNTGEDAFRPDEYGRSITVVRKISATANSFVILNHHGKKVTQGRNDLDLILEHFSIDVSNPCAVMTQDGARSFLHSGKDEDKYKFFMQATMLEKAKRIEDMKIQESHLAYKLAWSHVAKLEHKEIQPVRDQLATEEPPADLSEERRVYWGVASKKLAQVNQEIVQQEKMIQDAEQESKTIKEACDQMYAEFQQFNDRKMAAEAQAKDMARQFTRLKSNKKGQENQMLTNQERKRQVEQEIQEITERYINATQNATTQQEQMKAKARELVERADAERREVTEVLEQLKQEQARLQGQLNDLVARAEEERRQVQEKAQQKSNLSMQSGNELTKFGGPAVPKLMDLIKKNVKRFIKLRPDYASAWAVAVDAAISSTFNSFIVHDFHDKGVFMDLCRQSCYIKDGTRMRIQGRTQITTPNRSRHSPKLGVDHKAALAQVDTQLQEHQTELRRLEDELRLEKKDLEKINRQVNDKRKQKGQKEAAYVNAETQMEEVERDVLDETQMGGSGDVTLLQQEFEQLEAESIQLKQENETLREQLEQAEQARNEAAALVQSEQEKVTDYGARQQEANLLSESALKQEEKHKENLAKTYLILNNIQNKIAEKEKEIQDKMQQKEQLTREAEAGWSTGEGKCQLCPWEKLQALGGIDLEMNEQKQTALQVEYEHCKKAIRKHEQQQQMSGISLEEATENFERMERKLRNTKRRIENVSKPYWRMVHLVENRSEKVKQTSKNIKRMVSHQFNSYMQKRGNFGQISVNHKNQTLEMVVKMGQHANKDGSIQAVQNTKTLSGGERSYATLSFVLSLGSETESPFRAMDEFDVFMDAANRKVAVSLLLSFAKQRVHRQFLYLTPLKVDMLDKELESGYVNCQRLQPAER
eukprot:gene7858-9331_t